MFIPLRRSTLAALARIYRESGRHVLHRKAKEALRRRGLLVCRVPHSGEDRDATGLPKLTQDGLRLCRALFGPLDAGTQVARMNAEKETGLYFVVLWNFEFDESGEMVREGVVFTDAEAAKRESDARLLDELDYSFASRLKPVWSERRRSHGYVVGDVVVRAVPASGPMAALQEALIGRGEEIV